MQFIYMIIYGGIITLLFSVEIHLSGRFSILLYRGGSEACAGNAARNVFGSWKENRELRIHLNITVKLQTNLSSGSNQGL